MGSKRAHLKVFVDKKKKKVMYAEAEQDFVEILCSFFTLPLGTIARLSSKHEGTKDIKVGSLDSLYKSIENLDNKHFTNMECKFALVNPFSSSLSLCQKLKVNINNMASVDAHVDSDCDLVFFKKNTSFIITDDLNVIPGMLETRITLLRSLGVEYINLLEEKTIDFGLEEKSKMKALCAQVENLFVEMLFSFLTIPLGHVKHLTMHNSPPTSTDNMYNSISNLGVEKYFKSEEIKSLLLCPKLASKYCRVTDLLPIYEKDRSKGSFLKAQATFTVSDDLEVTVSPKDTITISKYNTFGIPVSDIEVMEVSIGEQEALLILKASFTSTSVLTDCLNSFKNAKPL
ncbi:uncharacterized protein LOC143542156 [Bidens hawaiensis]|uniref:uncharacterized protein LOC143542156 n=1 Tax=Bidens hawaiensis TaxID=980011 RepID=UPI00404A4C25